MRPLTLNRPKPLIEVSGRSLLDRALDAIHRSAVEQVAVNVHYLPEQIENHLKDRRDPVCAISDERGLLLDSGGGVKKALSLLPPQGQTIIVNSDSFWLDGNHNNLDELIGQFDPDQMDLMLLLCRKDQGIGFDGAGDFFMDSDGHLTRRGDAATAPTIYAGAIIANADLFTEMEEEVFSLNLLFDRAIARKRLFGKMLDGLWLHVGTPEAIDEAEEAMARFELAHA